MTATTPKPAPTTTTAATSELPIYDQAIAEAAIALDHAEANIHERYLQGGPEAVAEAAWWPGCGHTKAGLAALYLQHRAEAQARAAAATR